MLSSVRYRRKLGMQKNKTWWVTSVYCHGKSQQHPLLTILLTMPQNFSLDKPGTDTESSSAGPKSFPSCPGSFSREILSVQVKNTKDKHRNKKQTAYAEFAPIFMLSSAHFRVPEISRADTDQGRNSYTVCRLTVFNPATDLSR